MQEMHLTLHKVFSILAICCVFVAGNVNAQIYDQGDFILDIRQAENESDAYIQSELNDRSQFLIDLLDDVNSEIGLNQNVQVIFGTWPDIGTPPNAMYDAELKAIYIGYGLITEMIGLFDEELLQDEETDHVFANVKHTVLHEIGHALIDVNGIPTFEDENSEVLADQLAFIIFSELNENPDELASVVYHYLSRDNNSSIESQHLPDFERGLDYLCWMTGWNPDILTAEIREEMLGDRYCEEEYEELVFSWEDRLGPSFKN